MISGCRLRFFLCLLFATCLTSLPIQAKGQTTVALTTTVHAKATPDEKQLVSNLLALLEVEASQYDSLQVVERQQLDLALHEQVLSNTSGEQKSLQLGKLSAAQLILTAKLLESDDDKQRILVRVTESKTAVIRGMTIVPTGVTEIEESAAEIVDFLLFHASSKKKSVPTIAVLPFESLERFDRLRPLERGMRDLFASVLIRQKTCRVVQRSSMQQLLSELKLVQAGLTSNGKGLEGEPQREAAFVLRGEIDERITGTSSLVLVKVQLVDASSRQILISIEKSSKREDLPTVVSEIVVEALQAIIRDKELQQIPSPSGAKETDKLFELALRDVHRIHRLGPSGYGYRPLSIPGVPRPSNLHSSVGADTKLGVHLLKKSIDRLESVLFIEPDRLTAALPLAYCLSFHIDGIWNAERSEKLLREIRSKSSDSKFTHEVSLLLANLYFPHQGNFPYHLQKGTYDPKLLEKAFERRLEMFVAMQTEGVRSGHTLFGMLKTICARTNEEKWWKKLFDAVRHIDRVCIQNSVLNQDRSGAPREVTSLAYLIVKKKDISLKVKEEALTLLTFWSVSKNPWRAMHSQRHLFFLEKVSAEQYSQAIDKAYATPNEDLQVKGRRLREQSYRDAKVELAKILLQSGKAKQALAILLNTNPGNDGSKGTGYDFGYGTYGYTLAKCHEALGRKQEALATYIHYAELPTGYGLKYNNDFMGHIKALGGVPVSKDRDVNVRYPHLKANVHEAFYCRVLATDGKQLFCGGGYEQGRVGKRAIPIRSVQVLNLKTNTWTHLDGPDDRVSCLVVEEGFLWAGTDSKGLWRQDLSTGKWRSWTVENGLPTNSIVQLAVNGHVGYVSVGNLNQSGFVVSGGVVRIDAAAADNARAIHVYRSDNAPQTAPQSMAINDGQLVVRGLHHKLRALDLRSDKWTLLNRKSSPVVATGSSGIWVAPSDHIATLLHKYKESGSSFLAKTRLTNYPVGIYRPNFLLEHQGELWIGGPAWRKFGDMGLFRLDLKDGNLKRYGPRDGFRYSTDQLYNSYECYNGVWARNCLWVATSFGLTEIAMRDPTQTDEETPIEKYALQIKYFLPTGWDLTANSVSIRLRREEPVLVTSLYGRPPQEKDESEGEYLQRIGSTIPLEINLSFTPRLSRGKYERYVRRLKYLDLSAKNGFPNKAAMSRYYDEREKARLPTYFTQQFSVYVNGVPPQYTMHNNAALREIKQLFTKINTVLQLYENADPLPH